MTARQLSNLKSELEATGWASIDGNRYHLRQTPAPVKDKLPWEVSHWEVEARGAELRHNAFALRMNAAQFLSNVEDYLRELFPSFRTALLQGDKKSGFWLLLEFMDQNREVDQSSYIESEAPIDRGLPHGLAGVHLTAMHIAGQISLFMTRHYFIGNVPGSFFIELPKVLNKSLLGQGLADKASFNANIVTVSCSDLRLGAIERYGVPEDLVTSLDDKNPGGENGLGQIRLGFDQHDWSLQWNRGEAVEELLVPPMEILEQKEVARRFQRLDELILLEDFQGALSQCQEYLDKHPHSLFLMRRWAFLALWAGRMFEQKYLDAMLKYDPSNLMTLSLAIQKGLREVEPDAPLESLSKLGSTLGSSIADFEGLDIASLTLPEMLGDAWNRRDGSRAVNCYDRVLLARGEIPRVLVKLIRLMRVAQNATAEETYMDRLLACDVPVKTRASIYFRLAEIKQKADTEDASRWALKSWHTNKTQVRYAILAADLLIEMQRPQDAAHVLVETSELLEIHNLVEGRLELEIKIATVWLDSMQRIDLAAERITRALEIIGDDLSAFDKVIELTQKLDDMPMFLDIVKRGMAVADKKGDAVRSGRYVQLLTEQADPDMDSVKTAEIYTLVLKTTLLEASRIEALFQNPVLDLPLHEVADAIASKVALLPTSSQGPYYLMLGDVSHDRFDDERRIFSFYEKAVAAESVSSRAFDFLEQFYQRTGNSGKRYALLQKKLTYARESEKGVLLRELYYFDDGVGEADKDNYALQILAHDGDDVGPIEERLHEYQQKHQGEALINLLMQLGKVKRDVFHELISSSLTALDSMSSPMRPRWIGQLLDKLIEIGEDKAVVARLTLQYLWKTEETQRVRSALGRLVALGEIPSLPPGELLAEIEDPAAKVRVLLIFADRSHDFEEILAYEREALRIVKDIPAMVLMRVSIQKRLATKVEFTVDELDQFLAESGDLDQSDNILHVLGAQLRLSQHGDHQLYVLDQIEAALPLHPLLEDDATALAGEFKTLGLEKTFKLRLSWFENHGLNFEIHDEAMLDLIFGMPDAIAYHDLVNTLVPHVLKSTAKFRDVLHKALRYSLAARDAMHFQKYWNECMLRLEEKQETIEFLQFSAESFAALNLTTVFLDRLEQFVFGTQLDPSSPILEEVRLFQAEQLIEHDLKSRRARVILEDLYAQRSEEPRIWAGLIVLYREAQAETDLYELLYKVLPALRDDPKCLETYNVNLSSLESDFEELSHRMGARREEVPSTAGLGDEGVISMQSAPLDLPTNANSTFSLAHARTQTKSVPRGSLTGSKFESAPFDPNLTMFTATADGKTGTALRSGTGVVAPPGAGTPSAPQFNLKSVETGTFELSPGTSANDASAPPRPPFLKLSDVMTLTNAEIPAKPEFEAPMTSGAALAAAPAVPASPSTKAFTNPSGTWRHAARNHAGEVGLLSALLAQPLPEPLEQVVAVQVAALLEDQIAGLDAFSTPIWRSPDAIHYDLKWTDRMNREMFHPGIKSPLARLLKALFPLFTQAFANELGLVGVADRLKMAPDDVLRARKPLEWTDEVVQRSNLKHYTSSVQDNGYHLYHLPSIGDRFQFDATKRDIYIDRNHYMIAPASHLYHRLAFLLRAVSLDYLPFLHLSAGGEIFPFLMKCRRSLDQSDPSLKGMADKDPLRAVLAQSKDRDHLMQLFKETGNVSADKISQTVSCFVEQIYRLNLAESLDLIGVVETITGSDLCSPKTSSTQRLSQSASARSIVAFAAELKLTSKA